MSSFNEYLIYTSCYLVGSIPFGILVARFFGVKDLTSKGSGNSGATNVVRVAGKKAGVITLILDFLKGFIPIYFLKENFSEGYQEIYIASGIIVIGHCYSIFRGFKGGKGVATGLGVTFAIDYRVGLAAVLIWGMVFLLSRISSLAALVAFGILPIAAFSINPDKEYYFLLFFIFLSMLIYIKHYQNIFRLINGEEKGFHNKANQREK